MQLTFEEVTREIHVSENIIVRFHFDRALREKKHFYAGKDVLSSFLANHAEIDSKLPTITFRRKESRCAEMLYAVSKVQLCSERNLSSMRAHPKNYVIITSERERRPATTTSNYEWRIQCA